MYMYLHLQTPYDHAQHYQYVTLKPLEYIDTSEPKFIARGAVVQYRHDGAS